MVKAESPVRTYDNTWKSRSDRIRLFFGNATSYPDVEYYSTHLIDEVTGQGMKFKRASLFKCIAFCVTLWPGVVEAQYCKARPSAVFVHDNQSLYFTADNLCEVWCQINPSWSDANKDRAFSLLTTAIAQGRPLVFFFQNGCGKQQVYAQPQIVSMTREQ